MFSNRRSIAICSVLVLSFAWGCGSKTEAGTRTREVGASKSKEGWQEVKTSGFSISVPDDWTPIDLAATDLETVIAAAAKANPGVAASSSQIKQMAASGTFKLFVMGDQDPSGLFTENLNVVAVSVPAEPPLDDLDKAFRAELAPLVVPGTSPESTRVSLPAGTAIRMSSRIGIGGSSGPVASLGYMIPSGKTIYTVTFSCLEKRAEAMAGIAEEIMATFRPG